MNKFKCYQCGKCCKIEKYSTVEEFEICKNALQKQGVSLLGAKLPNNYVLWPKPCPALEKIGDIYRCRIHESRPYVCRQFLCGKQSKNDDKPWYSDGKFNMSYFNWLLTNNKEFSTIKEEIENEAATYGNAHGWKLKKIIINKK